MKKIYLLLLIFFAQRLSAQVVITAADIGVAGDVIPMQIVNYELGAPAQGGNMSWDFTNLMGVGNDTLRYLNPSEVSGGGAFPQSTFVLQDNIVNQFMQTETGGLFLNGFGIAGLDQLPVNIPIAIGPFRLNPRIRVLNFPTQFGNAQSNFVSQGSSRFTFAYDTTLVLNGVTVSVDSVRINATVRVENNIVGDGTVSFVGIAEPALLQKAFQRIAFTINVRTQIPPLFPGFPPTYIWVPLPFSLPSITNTFYRFWSPGKKGPLFEITMDSAGTTTQLARAQRYLLITDSKELAQATKQFEVYPNPASDAIHLRVSPGALKNEKGMLNVFNSQGKCVLTLPVKSETQSVNISSLLPGVYWLKLESESAVLPPKRLIVRQ